MSEGSKLFVSQLVAAGVDAEEAERLWPLWMTCNALKEMYNKQRVIDIVNIVYEQPPHPLPAPKETER